MSSLIKMCLKQQAEKKERINKAFTEKSRYLTSLENWYYDCIENPLKAMGNRDMAVWGYDPETHEEVLVSDIALADIPLSVSKFAKTIGKKVAIKATAQEIAIKADGMEDVLFNTVVSNDYKSKASQRFLPGLYGKTTKEALALGYTEKELVTLAIKQGVRLNADGVFTDAK